MPHYWVSSNKGTCWVYVDDKGIIRDCAALWKRFRTQSFSNLVKWLGDAKVVEINKKEVLTAYENPTRSKEIG